MSSTTRSSSRGQEPAPRDHLVGGLVPLAGLALAGIAYPRLRAGARAVLALCVGTVATVGGVAEAGYHALEAGPSGDDVSGLAMLAAGIALLAVGCIVLWRSRRLDERRARRYARRALVAVAGALAAFEIVVPVALAYVVTHASRPAVPTAHLGAPHEDVSITTADGLELRGWYVPSRNGAAVIAFPGRTQPQPHARMLVRHRYGVLLFDRRGEGQSEGDPNGLGWGMARDIAAATAFLRARPDVADGRVGGLGLSVGGEVLLEAAAETDGLRAVVSEGAGIRSLREALQLRGVSRWLTAPYWAITTGATAVFAGRLPPSSLEDLVPRIAPRPVLLVYAAHGQGGEELNPVYFAAAGEPKELWRIPDGGHTGGIEARLEEYERRVVGFFDRALLGADRTNP
jgi:fermentation-respiration switch protein FrsA (DUF1100 family)